MITRLITIACLALLVAGLGFVLWAFCPFLKRREERIAFLRGFKKGKYTFIYLVAIPLYWVGYTYQGEELGAAFFKAVSEIVQLVVLKFDFTNIKPLMEVDALYSFTIYFCFVMVVVNAILFAVSLFFQRLWCGWQAFKVLWLTHKSKLFLFGNNQGNISIYESDKKRSKTIIGEFSDEDCEKLYVKKISFVSSNEPKRVLRKVFKLIKRSYWKSVIFGFVHKLLRFIKKKEHILVINTGSDDENVALCKELVAFITDKKVSENLREHLFRTLKVFVFGDPKYEAIYEDIVSSGLGCIHYVNKYQKIAMDFIDKYPFTLFMDETHIDYKTSLIKEGVDINVLLIGFGKTAQQIFLTSVANNQFLTQGAGDPVLKEVKYHIFDKEKAENDKNLNHGYFRYGNERDALKASGDYLELPAKPADDRYEQLDINDGKFYANLKAKINGDPRAINFLVIAFGSDLENIDLAQKLVEKREEWGFANLIIFVKARAWCIEQTLIEQKGCYFIGNEKEAVYNIEKILGDDIFRMSQRRNVIYDLEYDIKNDRSIASDEKRLSELSDASHKRWYREKTQMERESSLYCCLSLRSKLHLMGLDYRKKEEGEQEQITKQAYLALYAGDDMPDVEAYKGVTVDGKEIVDYPLELRASRRRNMAIHEHQRWNSFMITKGVIPASRTQILTEKVWVKGKEKFSNGKNYALRRHGNLTTFAGLVEFRKMLAGRPGSRSENETAAETEKKFDVICYDYQLLDDAYWLLEKQSFMFIEKPVPPHKKKDDEKKQETPAEEKKGEKGAKDKKNKKVAATADEPGEKKEK